MSTPHVVKTIESKNIEEICCRADLIIAAVGIPKMVKSNCLRSDNYV